MTKSLCLLAHPLVLLAVGLVALNDFVLKPLSPSWITGKLSDIGMLFFLPLLIAGLLEFILPRRWAAGLGFGATGVVFVLLKVSPLTAGWLDFLPLRSIPDPIDLLALPALAVSFALWRSAPREVRAPAHTLGWRLVLLPLAALVALADAAMPDQGVDCLAAQDGSLYARTGYGRTYASRDGGFTWQQESDNWEARGGCELQQAQGILYLTSAEDGVQYRITGGVTAERSIDGGGTWQAVGAFEALPEAEEAYVNKTRQGNLDYRKPPLDALVDPASGNLVLAMGLEGALVVRPDGSWEWAAVGENRHGALKASGPAGYLTLLTGELILALLAGMIWLGSSGLAGTRRSWLVVSVLAWLTLAGTAVALHPDFANDSYTGIVSVVGLIVTGVLTLALLIGAAINLKLKALRRLPMALLVAVLVALPYLLWALGVLPSYWLALGLAAVVVVVIVILGKEMK
jgi:hypothetical protein